MNSVSQGFGATYADARALFLAAARACDARIESHVHPTARGAQGEPLAMDIALLGRPDAPSALVVTSGTHGGEGFCGSGCQVALLADEAFVRSAEDGDVALVFVHAVNPYGFSHLRRVNEDNVDLNRNFRDFSRPAPANPAYAELHALLVPAQWPPTPENQQAIGAFIAQHGIAAFQAAVSTGQYEFPDGLFYGGARPTWSNRTLRAVLRERVASRYRFGWIDVHTGLGPAGHGEKIHMGRDDASELARTRTWWGEDVTSFHQGTSTSAAVQGWIGLCAYDECPNAAFTGIGLEFGTVPLEQVLHALRGDHWLHLHPDAPAAVRDAVKAAMRTAFYTDDDAWKAQVVRQACDAAYAALRQLAADRIEL